MAGVPRKHDLVDRLISLERRIKRIEVANPPKATENFIIDPVTVRAFPPAISPPRTQIRGLGVRLGAGGPITVDMNVQLADGTIVTLWTFTGVPGDGTVSYIDLTVDGRTPFDCELADLFYPEVTEAPDPAGGSAAHDLTASFVMGP